MELLLSSTYILLLLVIFGILEVTEDIENAFWAAGHQNQVCSHTSELCLDAFPSLTLKDKKIKLVH